MSRITEYGALSSADPDDVLVIVDVSDTTMAASGTTKKVTVAGLGGVDSVNGHAGTVVLAASDVGADASGAAASALAAAESFATSAVATEAGRAGTAEALKLAKASNLSDVASAATALANLGGAASAALAAEVTRAGAAEGLALKAASNLTDVASAATARANLGLGTAATQPSSAFDSAGAATAAQAAAVAASLPALAVAAASASATLAVNTITQVTAASNLTMTLPSPVAGALIVVERESASTGTVAVTGSIRGAGGSTITLQLGAESEMFFGTGSTWEPVAGHKTLSSLDARYPRVINVAAPSGDATGVTDLANILAARSALPAGGGTIQLQAGTYQVPAPASDSGIINMTVNNSVLAGMGMGVTTIQVTAGSLPATGIVRTPSGVQNSKITFRDFTLDGNGAAQTGSPRIIGFFCGVTPDSTQTDTDIAVIRCEAMNCTGYGFDPHERTTRLLLLNCVSHDNGFGGGAFDGFTLDGNYDATVIGCVAYSNSRHGFNLTTASARCRLVGCEAAGNGSSGFNLVNGSKFNELAGSLAYGNTGDGIFVSGVPNTGTVIDGTQGADNSVKDCLVLSSGTNGIHIFGSPRNHVAGCTVRDSSQAVTNTSAQILLDDDAGSNFATGNTVTGCDLGVTGVTNTPLYGIREHASGDDFNTYLMNASAGATSAQVSLQGAHSQAITAGGNAVALADGTNLHLGTVTGTEIGTTTSDKIGFYGATPIGQQAATNELGTVLSNFGLRAAGGAFPITTSGLCQLTGAIRFPFTARVAGATLTGGSSAENETVDATSGAITINLAAIATAGYKFTIKKIDSSANAVTVDSGSGNTIDGARTFVLATQYKYVTVMSTATSGVWYVVANN